MRKHGINRSTFFKWRSKYGEANVSDVTRLRELEAEHARLKLVYADLALEKGVHGSRGRSVASRPPASLVGPRWLLANEIPGRDGDASRRLSGR